MFIFLACMTFYSCRNIAPQDLSPGDISKIINVILSDGEYMPEPIIEFPTEPEPSTEPPTQSQTQTVNNSGGSEPADPNPDSNNPNEPTDSADDTVPATETPTEPEPEEPNEPEEPIATVIDIRDVFPDAPEKFRNIPFPESVRFTKSLKENMINLANFSAKDFTTQDGEKMPFYIATTDAALITPLYNGGMLTDSRRYRNEIVGAECGAEIKSDEKPRTSIYSNISKSILADDVTAHIICAPFDIQSELIRNGLVTNLKKIPFLDFGAEYYNASATEAYSINGNIYGLVSDLTFDSSTLYSVFYNRTLIDEYNLTDPVKLYKNGKWDYDGMFAVSKEFTAAAAGLNGYYSDNSNNIDIDSEIMPKWSIGFDKKSADIIINGLFASSGGKYFTNDAYGFPVYGIDGSKALGLIDAISRIFSPYSDLENGAEPEMNNYLESESDQRAAFIGGNVLFSLSKLDMIPYITTSEFDWGILPVPGINGENSKFSFADGGAMSISVPRNTRNTEACGIVIRALSMASHKQLKDIYVLEQMMYHLRDVNSVNALTEIVNNISFNQYNAYFTIPEIANATGGLLNGAVNGKGDFETLYESGRTGLDAFFRDSGAGIFKKN